MGIYDNGIEGLIIKDTDGNIEFQEDFTLNDEKIEELLDKIIPLENKEFITKKNLYFSFDMTSHISFENIEKDNLIDVIKQKIYIVEDNINERLLEKYMIKHLVIDNFSGNDIEIPKFIEEIKIKYCSIKNLVIPKTIKRCGLSFTRPKKLTFLGDLDELQIDFLPELPNVKKLILNINDVCNLDFLPHSITDLTIRFCGGNLTNNISIDNLPNSVKTLHIQGIINTNIPPFIENLKIDFFGKVIVPKTIKKLNCELFNGDELIFLDEEYNFEEVNIVNCKKIVNLPKNLKIVNNEIHFP